MKIIKKISSFVLSIVLTLSLAMPYLGTVRAANDDLTGWTKGSATTSTITGNPTDGWDLALSAGTITDGTKNIYYTADISVSNLKVVMDLSSVAADQTFYIGFATGNYGLSGWAGDRVYFKFKKVGNNLNFRGHYYHGEVGVKDVAIDYSKPVEFEFLQDSNGKWQPAINGTICPMGTATNQSTDVFVTQMETVIKATQTSVMFGREYNPACTLKDIKFVNKSATADDLTGWTKGSATTSTITGNPTDGWDLALSAGTITDGTKNIYYTADISVSNLKVVMDLSEVAEDQTFYIGFSNGNYGLSGWAGDRVYFKFKKVGNNLNFRGHYYHGEVGATDVAIDYSQPVEFEFLKDSNGKWQPAINGTICPMGTATNQSTDVFVTQMETVIKATQTKVMFGREYNPACTLKSVKFIDKNFIPDDLTGWTKGSATTSTITGNPIEGWDLALSAGTITDGTKNIYYTADISVSNLKVVMDLSEVAADQTFYIGFANGNYGLSGWAGDRVYFKFKKVGNNLNFRGHYYHGEVGVTDVAIDYSQPVEFEFLKDSNGKWQPAINGTICPMGTATNQSTDVFVTQMETVIKAAQTTVMFGREYDPACGIKILQFIDKSYIIDPDATPEDLGFSRVTVEDFKHSYTSYSGNTVNQPYKDGSLNNKYLDVDLTMPEKSSAMLAFATNTSQWYGYRIYVNGSGELEIDQALGNSGSTHKKSYDKDELGLNAITDKFNLKIGVQFGEGFGTADACDATYYLWINNVLIDKVTYTGAKGMGSNLNFLDGGSNDTVIVSDPMPKVLEQKTPEEMGFSRVTIGDFKHFDGEYKHNTAWVACQKGDLNNKYLDVNITWPETASTYLTYASPNQWHGYRIYTQDGNLIIEQALSGLKQTYTPEKLGLTAITDKFNMKFGTIFGEGFGVEEACDATYVLWINDVVVDEVTYKNVKGMGNGMNTLTSDGHKGSIMLEIPVDTPFAELTPSDFGLDNSSIQKKAHVATYDSNSLDATAITAKVNFSDKSGDYMMFGSEDAGIRLQMKKNGNISVVYVDSEGTETQLKTLTAKKAGVSSLSGKHEWRFTFRIKGTDTKNTLTMEIYINKTLYNFEAISLDNVELDVLKRVWTIGSESGSFKINTVKYEELTLHDFSIFDIDVKEKYSKRNYCDYASFDGSAFTSILNFSATAVEDRLEIGGNDWGGLSVIYTKKDQIWLVFVDPSGDGEKTVTYLKPEALGLDTFANKDLTMRITFDLLEVAEDTYNLKLGIYVNGTLYNDQHYTVEDAAVKQLTRTLRVKVFNGPFKAKSVETKSDLSIYGFDSNWKKTLGVL